MPYYKLDNFLREEFGRPLGAVISNADLDGYIGGLILRDESLVTVGDRTTEYFVSHGHRPKLQIVDSVEKRTRRAPPVGGYDRLTCVSNPAGGVSGEAIESIRSELRREGAARVQVIGEEDLLVLPAILFVEEGADVFYGQPNVGMVHVKAILSVKKKVAGMLIHIGYPASV